MVFGHLQYAMLQHYDFLSDSNAWRFYQDVAALPRAPAAELVISELQSPKDRQVGHLEIREIVTYMMAINILEKCDQIFLVTNKVRVMEESSPLEH